MSCTCTCPMYVHIITKLARFWEILTGANRVLTCMVFCSNYLSETLSPSCRAFRWLCSICQRKGTFSTGTANFSWNHLNIRYRSLHLAQIGYSLRYSSHRNCVNLSTQVDGIEVAGLTSQEVLALLTGPEKQVSLVLCREPSVTLL